MMKTLMATESTEGHGKILIACSCFPCLTVDSVAAEKDQG